MPDIKEQPTEDYEKPFLRARRTLRHLWHITRGDKVYNPNDCDGCKEIHHFLTDSAYRGDREYPVGERIDPDWRLGPDEMELPPGRGDALPRSDEVRALNQNKRFSENA